MALMDGAGWDYDSSSWYRTLNSKSDQPLAWSLESIVWWQQNFFQWLQNGTWQYSSCWLQLRTGTAVKIAKKIFTGIWTHWKKSLWRQWMRFTIILWGSTWQFRDQNGFRPKSLKARNAELGGVCICLLNEHQLKHPLPRGVWGPHPEMFWLLGSEMVHSSAILYSNTPTPPLQKFVLSRFTLISRMVLVLEKSLKSDLSLRILIPVTMSQANIWLPKIRK